MAVDPTASYLLSGSLDSKIHVWSIQSLLSQHSISDGDQSMRNSPLRSLTKHRAAVNALLTGHGHGSVNFAISGSDDNSCIIWDYQQGTTLRTFLLSSSPLCFALDHADRAVYIGFEDGSVQLINFFKCLPLLHPFHDSSAYNVPTQPPPSDRWYLPSVQSSSVLCLMVSYDGTSLITGHENGRIEMWDIAKGCYASCVAHHSTSITNLCLLPPHGFRSQPTSTHRIHNVIKPDYTGSTINRNNSDTDNAVIPYMYTFTAQFVVTLSSPEYFRIRHSITLVNDRVPPFDHDLYHPSLHSSLIQEGLSAHTVFAPRVFRNLALSSALSVDGENLIIRKQIAHARAAQQAHAINAAELGKEILRRNELAKTKKRVEKVRRRRRLQQDEQMRTEVMGSAIRSQRLLMLEDQPEIEARRKEISSSADGLTGEE